MLEKALLWAEKMSVLEMKREPSETELGEKLDVIHNDMHISLFHADGAETALLRVTSLTKILWQRVTNPLQFKETDPFGYDLLRANADSVYERNSSDIIRPNLRDDNRGRGSGEISDTGEILLTKEGYASRLAELDELKTIKRSEILKRVREILFDDNCDISDGSDYDAAKNEQTELEYRINELEDLLKNAKVVEMDTV